MPHAGCNDSDLIGPPVLLPARVSAIWLWESNNRSDIRQGDSMSL
jgi:hypothetical protein